MEAVLCGLLFIARKQRGAQGKARSRGGVGLSQRTESVEGTTEVGDGATDSWVP